MALVKDTLVIFGGRRTDKIFGDIGFIKLSGSDLKFKAVPEAYSNGVAPNNILTKPIKVTFS